MLLTSYVILSMRENVVCGAPETSPEAGSKWQILLDGFGDGEEVLLFAEGVGAAEDDLFVDGLSENFVMNFVFDCIGLSVDLGFERFFLIRLTGLHNVGEEQFHIEDVLTALLMSILRVEVGIRLTRTATFLIFCHTFALGLELGLEQLLLARGCLHR